MLAVAVVNLRASSSLFRLRDPIRGAWILSAIALTAVTDVGVVWNDLSSDTKAYSDFAFIWPAGALERPYADIEHFKFAYPPTSFLLITAFSQLPFLPALILWSSVGTAALCLAAWRLTNWKIAALAVLTPSWLVAALTGQTSLFVATFAISGVVAGNSVFAGLCFAAAAVLKPQAMVALPIALMATRDWRTILWTAAWAAGLVALSAALWGIQLWSDWFAALPKFQQVLVNENLMERGVGLNGLGLEMGLPLYGLGALLGAASVWRTFGRQNPVDRYAALVCGAALISPYMLHYDLAGLGAAGIAILADRSRSILTWAGAALAISYILAPFGIILLALSLCRGEAQGPAKGGVNPCQP